MDDIQTIKTDVVALDRRRKEEIATLQSKYSAVIADQEKWRRMYDETSRDNVMLRGALGHSGGGGWGTTLVDAPPKERALHHQMMSLQHELEESKRRARSESERFQATAEDTLRAEVRAVRQERDDLEARLRSSVPRTQMEEALVSNQKLHVENDRLVRAVTEYQRMGEAGHRAAAEAATLKDDAQYSTQQMAQRLALMGAEQATALRTADTLRQRVHDLQAEVASRGESHCHWERESRGLQRSAELLRTERDEARAAVDRQTIDASELRAANGRLANDLWVARTELRMLEAKLKGTAKERDGSVAAAEGLFDRLRARMEEAGKASLDAQARCLKAEAEATVLREAKPALERAAGNSERREAEVATLTRELAETRGTSTALSASVAALKAQLKGKEEELVKAQGFINSFVRPCLDAARSHNFGGV